METYLNYIKMCMEFHNNPQLNIRDFKNLYSIFCFDVSALDEKLSINVCDITVLITKKMILKQKHIV